MVKGRRYRLVYSNRYPFDTREYGLYVYTHPSNFEKLVRTICKKEIEEAKKRVFCGRNGFYRYTPSKEYLKALKRFHSH